jgi:outer membrane protease
MRDLRWAGAGVVALVLFFGGPTLAEDKVLSAGLVELGVGTGVQSLFANEIVYLNGGPDTTELSHLFWMSAAPVLTSTMKVNVPDGWLFAARGSFAAAGISYMEDYDWIDPGNYGRTYDFNDWTDRSQHVNTTLDWYFDGSILVGRDLAPMDSTTVNINGGFRYIDVMWAAKGSHFVYSDFGGFRDHVGDSPANDPAISYRQQFPALFLGADTTIVNGDWTFGLGAQAGMTLGAQTHDWHWNKDSHYVDTFHPAPLVGVSGSADFALSEMATLFIAGSVDQVFRARGDEVIYSIATGAQTGTATDVEGTDLFSAKISAGVKGRF